MGLSLERRVGWVWGGWRGLFCPEPGCLYSSVSAVLVEWPLVGGGWVLSASGASPLRAGFSWLSGGVRGATDTSVFPWFSSSTG